jgi:hypothetical protein
MLDSILGYLERVSKIPLRVLWVEEQAFRPALLGLMKTGL